MVNCGSVHCEDDVQPVIWHCPSMQSTPPTQSADVRHPTHVLSTQKGFWLDPEAVQSGSVRHGTHEPVATSHWVFPSAGQSPAWQHALQTFPQQIGVLVPWQSTFPTHATHSPMTPRSVVVSVLQTGVTVFTTAAHVELSVQVVHTPAALQTWPASQLLKLSEVH